MNQITNMSNIMQSTLDKSLVVNRKLNISLQPANDSATKNYGNTTCAELLTDFICKLCDDSGYPISSPTDLKITVVYTGTASNGDEDTGSTLLTIPAGSHSNHFNIREETDLDIFNTESLEVVITKIKDSSFDTISFDDNVYRSSVVSKIMS